VDGWKYGITDVGTELLSRSYTDRGIIDIVDRFGDEFPVTGLNELGMYLGAYLLFPMWTESG
jgi:hypothetical protein